MLSADRDALICDLAEVYGIFDHRALPVSMLATLAVGLREDSRIKRKMSGMKLTRIEMLAAAAVDRLSMLLWINSEDGRKGENRPVSVLGTLLGEEPEDSPVEGFDTAEEFEEAWAMRTGVRHGR